MKCDGVPVAAKFITNNDEVYSAFADVATLTYVKTGAITLYSESATYEAEQGDCFFVQAYADLKAKRRLDPVVRGFESIVFVIYNKESQEIPIGSEKVDPFFKVKSERLASLFFELDKHFLSERSITPKRWREMRAIIDTSVLGSVETSLEDILNSKNQLFRKFLYDHLTKNMTIDALAKKFGMSTSTFQRAFKKEIGISPYQWIKDQRLHYARCEMQFKQVSASKIYLELGFEDLGHFSREFKKKFGYSPREHYQSASIEIIR